MGLMKTPEQVAENLRLIADRLDLSSKPNPNQLIHELQSLTASFSGGRTASHRRSGPAVPTQISLDVSVNEQFDQVMKSFDKFKNASFEATPIREKAMDSVCRQIASVMIHIADEAETLGLWDLDEGERTKAKWDHALQEDQNEENLESRLNLVKRQIDKFIQEMKSGSSSDSDSEVFTSAP
jgi:hypothetical protein